MRGQGEGDWWVAVFDQVELLAVAAVATFAEAAVAAEVQRPAMDEGLVRKAMAFRVKYRISDNTKNK